MIDAKATTLMNKSPVYAGFSTSGTALAVGPARVELFSHDALVAEKGFEVVGKL